MPGAKPVVGGQSAHLPIALWGGKVKVLYNMHHWPVWGNEAIAKHVELQRDMYRYINDETLRLANHGYTMVEIAEMFEMPEEIDTHFSNRGYYGSITHMDEQFGRLMAELDRLELRDNTIVGFVSDHG